MTPTRVLPDLQCSLVCDEIRQEINGNLMLLGVITVVRVPQMPITVPQLFVFNRWTAGLGEFTETIRWLAPDQTTVLRKSDVRFALRDPGHNATNVSFFGGLEFATPGVYSVEVLVDDVMKLRYPVPILHVPPPAGQGHPGQPPQAPQG